LWVITLVVLLSPVRFNIDKYYIFYNRIYIIVHFYFCIIITVNGFRHCTLLVFICLYSFHGLICIIINARFISVSCILFNDSSEDNASTVFASNKNFGTYYILHSDPLSSLSTSFWQLLDLHMLPYDVLTSTLIKFMIYCNKVLIEFSSTFIFEGIK